MKRIFFLFFVLALTLQAAALAKSDLAMGYEQLNNLEYTEALASFSLALDKGDSSLSEYAIYGMGKTYYCQKEYSFAAYEFEKVVSNYPESPLCETAQFYLVESYINAELNSNALVEIDKYLDKFPDADNAPHIAYLKGYAYEEIKDYRRAHDAYNEADLYYPLSSYAQKSRIAMKKLEKRFAFASIKLDPKKLYEKGLAYYKNHDYESAANIFNRLAMNFPKHKLSAKAFSLLGQLDIDPDQYEAPVAETSNAGMKLYKKGRAQGKKGRYGKAIALMTNVVNNYPNTNYADDAMYYLGVYYEKIDSPLSAASVFIRLVNEYPNSSYVDKAIVKAARIYYVSKDYRQAYAVYGLAKNHRTGSDTPQSLFMWGMMAEKLGKINDAAGIYYYLADKFDHTYSAYRARERLAKYGYAAPPFSKEATDKAKAILSDKNNAELAKYQKLMDEGLFDLAMIEAQSVIKNAGGETKESAQQVLGKVMHKSGEYSIPIRYVESKVKSAVYSGKSSEVPKDTWLLAYPKGYWDKVVASSKENGIDPYLTLAVIREESRFNPKALSRSRAHGLMQIMPSTGKILAKKLEIAPFKRSKLYNVETNLDMGTLYLSDLMRRFNGNIALVLAGYNGGPNRVSRWVNEWYGDDVSVLDMDDFVQRIPLLETRYYVQKVLGSYYEYKRLYGGRN